MARTYHAEGRQLAYFLRGFFVIGGIVVYYRIPGLHWGFLIGFIVVGVLAAELIGARWTKKRRAGKSRKPTPQTGKSAPAPSVRAAKGCRSDDVILSSNLSGLSGAEFERLLALYFRSQGYVVKEVGVGGSDGGVDLVITDRRGEKTAVQAKCYADHHMVPVMTVRELVAAKRNHDCILSLLVTTSDLTGPAKKEAEQFKVDYWHGGLLEQKLRAWGDWQPGRKRQSADRKPASSAKAEPAKARRETAASGVILCACGAPMVRRTNKQGEAFLGCSKFPSCRRTRSI